MFPALLHSHNHDTYTCGSKINNNDERNTLLKKNKPLALYERVEKGLCVRGGLETGQTATY